MCMCILTPDLWLICELKVDGLEHILINCQAESPVTLKETATSIKIQNQNQVSKCSIVHDLCSDTVGLTIQADKL